jgi:hypothetical protein
MRSLRWVSERFFHEQQHAVGDAFPSSSSIANSAVDYIRYGALHRATGLRSLKTKSRKGTICGTMQKSGPRQKPHGVLYLKG